MTNMRLEQSDGRQPGQIEIAVGEINDVEAHVIARFVDESTNQSDSLETVTLNGSIRGPYCEGNRTLPAEFSFRQIADSVAEAIIPDPCQWSRELPHVYHVNIAARRGEQLLAEANTPIGLQRTTPRRTGIEFPG
jgi:hypothetical protein